MSLPHQASYTLRRDENDLVTVNHQEKNSRTRPTPRLLREVVWAAATVFGLLVALFAGTTAYLTYSLHVPDQLASDPPAPFDTRPPSELATPLGPSDPVQATEKPLVPSEPATTGSRTHASATEPASVRNESALQLNGGDIVLPHDLVLSSRSDPECIWWPIPLEPANAPTTRDDITGASNAHEYVAFSLRGAQTLITRDSHSHWREEHADVLSLGGITGLRAIVRDRENEDIIVVGEHDPSRPSLTLDDLAVALRAALVHSQSPGVGIDERLDAHNLDHCDVHYAGGIEDTAFGRDVVDAEFRLRALAYGSTESTIDDFKSVWDRIVESVWDRKHDQAKLSIDLRGLDSGGRFWFQPAIARLSVNEDGYTTDPVQVVALYESRSEASYSNDANHAHELLNRIGDELAREVTMRFDEIGRVYPSIRRLPALYEMAAVAQALYNLQDVNAELGYWLNEYVVPTIATPRAVSAAGSARLSQSEMRLQRAIRIVRDAGVHERPDDDPPSEAAEAIEIAGDLLVDAWVLYGVEPHDAITRVKGVPTDIGRLDDLLGQKLEDLSRSIRIWN